MRGCGRRVCSQWLEETVKSAPQLEIKTVYAASKHGRVRRRVSVRAGNGSEARLVVIGILNLFVAGGLYCGTCWWADRELRVMLIMHTGLPGLDTDLTAGILKPQQGSSGAAGGSRSGATETALTGEDVSRQKSAAAFFVGTVVTWEALSVLAFCLLALAGGSMLGRAGPSAVRTGAIVVGFLALVLCAWGAYNRWATYERFVPDLLRFAIGGLVSLLAVVGLLTGRGVRGLSRLAAVTLIVSSAATVAGLYVLARYDAIEPESLPVSFALLVAVVFVGQSLWGWILLPLASRIR